jgi:hypothetical protein
MLKVSQHVTLKCRMTFSGHPKRQTDPFITTTVTVTLGLWSVEWSPAHFGHESSELLHSHKHLSIVTHAGRTWHKHISQNKELGITLTKICWLLRRKSKLSTAANFSQLKKYTNQCGLMEYNSGVRLPLLT